MKIFKADGLECALRILSEKVVDKPDGINIFELVFTGRGEIIWPNREGEGFKLSSVLPSLDENNCLESGCAISWPATASSMSLMMISENGMQCVFSLPEDPEGRHSEFRIFADSTDCVRISIAASSKEWFLTEPDSLPGVNLAADKSHAALQFQVGMIGPSGTPGALMLGSSGFMVLPALADRFAESFGPFGRFESEGLGAGRDYPQNPIIHIFGYASGHDVGYPDYTPSPLLGGLSGLSEAADELHRRGFLLSCYLNARIAEETAISKYPLLQAGVCRDNTGNPLVEIYQGRRFNIMEPSFEPWIEHLYMQAMMLRKCGADAVQLDQVAGRAPAVPVGSTWGAGYRDLIQRLQKTGLKVWIQGVSDYYPADWFEMTHRDLSILPGGVLRGGNPFGRTDLRLLKALNPAGRYLVPLQKARAVMDSGLPLIIDVLGARGRLPVYDDEYLAELAFIEKTGLNL